ncbi:hypothetical protein ONZ45_g10416 [Pleurotus djamor]|nr:hypothetical protein ONZ45_g10416 [Pleurotus djamor]
MQTSQFKTTISLLALGGLALLLGVRLYNERRSKYSSTSKSEISPDVPPLSDMEKRMFFVLSLIAVIQRNLSSGIASDVSQFLYDYPIHLLRLADLRLYTRTQLIRVFVAEVARELEKEQHANTNENHTYQIFSRLSRYAIFSHRWGLDELDYHADFSKEIPSGKSDGATKLRNFCEKARQYGCQYVWFDTGCIHSSNSAELDESIRSMYAWYSKAYVCIVYLAQTGSALGEGNDVDEWFQRGWTLQELLAPERLKFYNKDWNPLTNDKFDIFRGAASPPEKSIVKSVSKITGVDEQSLRRFRPENHNVRRILTWVSSRRTSRPEDMVYCLFGLLDVSLNIAYGEGEGRAFARLQTELLKRYDDRSLLVFDGETSLRNRMIPRSPRAYSSPFTGKVLPSDTLLFSEGITSPDISLSIYGLHLAIVLYAAILQPKPSSSTSSSFFCKDIGRFSCELTEDLDTKRKLFLGILGHSELQGRRMFFAVLLGATPYSHARYERILTKPPYFQFAAATILMNEQKDELVMLRPPEMIYID